MPFYEYRCNRCDKVKSFFFRSFSSVTEPTCPSCGSGDMTRLISRTAIIRSEDEHILSTNPERYLSGLDPQDKGSIVRWARKMGRELDEEVGSEFREMAERMEAGEGLDDPGSDAASSFESDL